MAGILWRKPIRVSDGRTHLDRTRRSQLTIAFDVAMIGERVTKIFVVTGEHLYSDRSGSARNI